MGGSIPERDGKHFYNTCTIYNKEGELVAKHRKVVILLGCVLTKGEK